MVLPFMGIKDIISPNSGFASNIILRNFNINFALKRVPIIYIRSVKETYQSHDSMIIIISEHCYN